MRNTLLIGAAACALYAAEPTVDGPRAGYVASKEGLRAVLGIVGSSSLSAPVATDLQRAVALPDSDIAAGMDGSGKLTLLNLADGTTRSLGIENVASLHVSPRGAALAARSGDRLIVLSRDGSTLADYGLPGEPARIAVSDTDSSVAVTVAEAEGEALYVLSAAGASRAFQSARIAALAFVPGSSDLLFAGAEGAIYRLKSDLEVQSLATIAGVTALAGDANRALAVAGSKIHAIPFNGENATSIDCLCEASLAEPLGGSKFLLVRSGNGPAWVLDATQPELRAAFIPEAVNE